MSIFPPAGPVFDIGGGNGTVSIAMQKSGYDVFLLEPEQAGVKEAMEKGLSCVICSTFDDAKFADNCLPAVGMFDVLEHIEDDESFLLKVHQALAPQGRVYITVPAFKFLWSGADVSAGHYRRYTRNGIAAVFRKAGFNVFYASCFFSLLIPPIYIFRSIPHLFSMKRSDPDWRHGHHRDRRSVAGSLLLKGLRWESQMILKRNSIPFGSSCLLVAEKI